MDEINHGKCTEISGVPTCSLGVWWLVAGPSEPVEYTFTQEGAHGANKTTGGILRYSGAHPTAPIGNTKANNAITPDTEPIALGITTTVANVIVLSISGVVDGEYAGITNSESTLFIIEARGSRPGLAASDAAYPSAETSTGDVSFENADEELWRTLTVEIKPDGPGPHTLTVAVGNDPGGDGSIGGGGTFAHGTSVEAAATSGTHSTFSSWQEGSPCGTVFDITSDQTCTADFTADSHTLTVAVGNDPGGDGSIGGGGTFAHGTSVEAAATSGTTRPSVAGKRVAPAALSSTSPATRPVPLTSPQTATRSRWRSVTTLAGTAASAAAGPLPTEHP